MARKPVTPDRIAEVTETEDVAQAVGAGSPGMAVIPDDGLFAAGLEVSHVPTAMLRAELARGLSLTADTLTRLGIIWAELERRGEDLSDLRRGLARTLPLIAAGRLAAESVVAFAGRPGILRAIEGLPLDQQRRLAAGEAIPVIDPSHPADVQDMPLAALPAASLRMVIGDGEVRLPSAQRLALRARSAKRRSEEGEPRRYRPRYDQEAGVVRIGKMEVALSDLLTELSSAGGPDRAALDLPEEYGVVRVRATHDELKKLADLSARTGLPDWELVRKAMRAFGII